jgi:YggT family protein
VGAQVTIDFIRFVFMIFNLLILARILISWVQLSPYHPVVQFLHNATEPLLAPIRRVLPPVGMFDLAPLVLIILMQVVEQILVQIVISTAF